MEKNVHGNISGEKMFVSRDSLNEIKRNIALMKNLRGEFVKKSEKIIYISNSAESGAMSDFVKSKNEFESNSDRMIEIIDEELKKLQQFQLVFQTNKTGREMFNDENKVLISNEGDKASIRTLEDPDYQMHTNYDEGIETGNCKYFMEEKPYAEEFRRVRKSIVESNRNVIDINKISASYIGESHLIMSESKRRGTVILREFHPFVANLLKDNQVFNLFPVTEKESSREKLPSLRDPTVKINVWGILKENIGKDLSKMAMPVYAKEPITLVQKMAELVEYTFLLRAANKCENVHQRLAYITGYFLMCIAQNKYRLKASFNSLLGETYEIVDGDLKFIIEAVSTHPPIQAFYCESSDFIINGNCYLKTNLSIVSMEFQTIGDFDIYLKNPKENYKITRPNISLHNYIVGDMYIWVKKQLIVTNLNTNGKSIVDFRAKGWSSKHDYEVSGTISDAQNQVFYKIIGRWDSNMSIVDVKDNSETLIANQLENIPDHENQYYFSRFAANMNYLTTDMIYRIAPTDARFRTDVRAYENGNLELSAFEKNRLEESQRDRRKNKVIQQPLWFSFEMNGKAFKSEYLGQYFEARHKQKWPSNIPDLFND